MGRLFAHFFEVAEAELGGIHGVESGMPFLFYDVEFCATY